MITRLEQSIAINPLDANSHLLMARYYEALAHNRPPKESNDTKKIKSINYSEQAEKEYKLTIKHQPSWDYAWAKQAYFYSNQAELSETDFIHAISKAMLLGPYEKQTQLIIIPLIFKHWTLVVKNKEIKERAIKIIKHTLKHDNLTVFTIDSAKKHQKLKELAPLLTKQWHKNKLQRYLKEVTNE
jgi:tetratricopeptide (TPR) repeat protein